MIYLDVESKNGIIQFQFTYIYICKRCILPFPWKNMKYLSVYIFYENLINFYYYKISFNQNMIWYDSSNISLSKFKVFICNFDYY